MESTAAPTQSTLKRGRLTAYVERHRLRWELAMALLTLVYVALSVLVDEGAAGIASVGVAILALVFFGEFGARCWDSESRLGYLREHWLDLITCLPFIGPLRVLRLLRLLGLLRLAHEIRNVAYIRSESSPEPTSLTWIVWPSALLLWLGAAYGLWLAERGHNPSIHSFGDALYMAFMTLTTVGYGDLRPITAEGKVLAGALVFLGLGLLGFISSQLTAHWLRVERHESSVESQLLAMRAEISDLKALLLQAVPAAGPDSSKSDTRRPQSAESELAEPVGKSS